ncbi:MAG: ABC transporter ATP-binding protein [Salibacteraceae bacterium]|mgnify:CR=1 FL=1
MKSLLVLNRYFFRYRWRLLLGILFVTASNIFAIFPAQIIRHAFDVVGEMLVTYQLFNGFESQNTIAGLLAKTVMYFGLLVFAMALIKGVFMFFMRQTIIVMSRLIEYDLKNDIFNHYQQLSLAFYKRNKTGDLMNRISEDVSRVRMYLGPAIMYTINLIVLFILVIITMLSVNAKMTLYVLLPLPVLSITIYYVSNVINQKSERVQAQLSNLSSFAQEAFSGIRVVKAYNRIQIMEDSFLSECNSYKDKSLALAKVNALFMPFMLLLIGLSTITTIFIGGQLAIAGEVSTGNIAEFIIYVNMLTWPVAALGWVTSIVQRAAASQERINEFLQSTPEVSNAATEDHTIKGGIEFNNVSFTYPDSGIQALKNFSFSIEPGKSLAIIGRTGSGKSTIANLICRLYDVTDGTISIDGRDIRQTNLDSLRRQIGYVPQEVFLFSDTIANNIAFGLRQDEIDESAVAQAARDASVYANIKEFPEGFSTKVGERGITLSGGQKQRISIARAIIRAPKILIFDDCLSAVDTETEEAIIRNLQRIMKDKTTIIISHRVSSVKHCDNILVLDDGKVIESGNHEALIEQQSVYFELFQKQLLEEEKVSP